MGSKLNAFRERVHPCQTSAWLGDLSLLLFLRGTEEQDSAFVVQTAEEHDSANVQLMFHAARQPPGQEVAGVTIGVTVRSQFLVTWRAGPCFHPTET